MQSWILCHMILQKIIDLQLKKHFLLLSMLKTIVLLNIYEENMIYFRIFFLMYEKFKRTAFIWNINIL